MLSEVNLEEEYGWLLDGIVAYLDEDPSELKHYGKKGMRWGVRNEDSGSAKLKGLGPDSITRKTKNGDEVTLSRVKPTIVNKAIANLSPKYVDYYNNSAFFTVKDKAGKTVGEANLFKTGDEINLNWIGIRPSARGKGYASAILKAAADFGPSAGVKKMTLEVPGDAPDARHIYEKLGFKVVKEATSTNDVWGGLTSMEYKFDKADAVAHSDIRDQVLNGLGIEIDEDVLAHYGKKGMKWGVTHERGPNGRVKSEDHVSARALRRKKQSEMSNKELKELNNRLQLEKSNKELQSRGALQKIKIGTAAAASVLAIGTTITTAYNFVNSPAGQAVIKAVKNKS